MSRFHPEKNVSQIVFDATGGEDHLKTMHLATIPNKPHLVKSGKDSFLLRTDDIDGAQHVPVKRTPRNLTLDTTDIPGTSSRPMFDSTKPPVDPLQIDDIEGARPRAVRHLGHSKRCLNPVDPQYVLSSKPQEPPPIPPFIRDQMYNADVEGASPATYRSKKPPRDIMKCDDISGARPSHRVRERSTRCDQFDVRDINNDGVFKTKRRVDPLEPVYVYDGQESRPEGFGKVRPPRTARADPDKSLVVTDIEGTTADASTKRYRAFKKPKPPREEDEAKPAEILMLGSMEKQTKELEKQEAIRKYRGDKIRAYESRNMHIKVGTGDQVQGILRQQREGRGNSRHETF
jgi:hypothetical protein